MSTKSECDLLLAIALDITSSLPAARQGDRLVHAIQNAIPSDAVGLLRLAGDELVPLAAIGLAPELLGHRFRLSEQPRFEVICRSPQPVLFPADSPLPDPYDGYVTGLHSLSHRVHSCLGCSLRIDGKLVGVLTLDALRANAFDQLDLDFVAALAALTAAALRTSDLFVALERQTQLRGQVARDLVREALMQNGGLLVGNSEAMVQLRGEIDQLAPSHFPVLVTGETGVGKELVVRTLHARSARADQPLIHVNCAALPEAIAESELFGHEKGSFTGAVNARLGKFQVADGASLFLDEIGELPLHLQPKLLRALQSGEVQSVGSDASKHVDVRVIAATNRDLAAEVRNGRFRADLLYRLDVGRLRVPPLRARKDDLPPLAGHICDRVRRQLGTGGVRLLADVHDALNAYDWPGNVRELENVLSRAILRAAGRSRGEPVIHVRAGDLNLRDALSPLADTATETGQPSTAAAVIYRQEVRDFERALVQQALAAADGNWAQAATRLGMHRSNLHHLAGRLGLRPATTKRR